MATRLRISAASAVSQRDQMQPVRTFSNAPLPCHFVSPFSVFRPAESPRAGETVTRQRTRSTEVLVEWLEMLKGGDLLDRRYPLISQENVNCRKRLNINWQKDASLPAPEGGSPG